MTSEYKSPEGSNCNIPGLTRGKRIKDDFRIQEPGGLKLE
jgi:hypothetical protein